MDSRKHSQNVDSKREHAFTLRVSFNKDTTINENENPRGFHLGTIFHQFLGYTNTGFHMNKHAQVVLVNSNTHSHQLGNAKAHKYIKHKK